MRITHLSIQNYKNLKDFNWTIDAGYSIALIVGKNASGKSNLMEAILHIFACVQRDVMQHTHFDYSIEYEIETPNKHKVRLESQGVKFSAWRDDEKVKDQQAQVALLPSKIFAYYAGTSKRIEDTFRLYKNPPAFEYYTPTKYKFVLFALLASPLDKIKKDFLQKEFGIEGLHDFSFKIQKPHQAIESTNTPTRDNFWNAPPDVLTLFEGFKALSSKSQKEKVFTTEKLALKFDGEVINQILDFPFLSDESDLFEKMIKALELGYIRDLTLNIKKTGVNENIIFENFSEGEKQRLAIRGIIELYEGDETLYLLDEPDAFAHPRWQWEFIPDLERALGTYSQVIYVTHSPLVLSSAKNNAFFMDSGEIYPAQETYGQSANVTLNKMEAQEILQATEDDFATYIGLIEEGKGESPEGVKLREELEEKYPLNHPKFDRADMLISY
ncbi:AAA family ATPase [uncultured Microscilla sp.]|uniref:AAA family ATPase n=1 Tax=uncultured Microscilla sp. TaxID=432653 RepID=UPI002633DE41|nr:ATP-binding protein [uncultured Microscilla sp.]